MSLVSYMDGLKDKIGEHEVYLTELENKVKCGEASEATLRTQKQARKEKCRLLGIIHDLLYCMEHGSELPSSVLDDIERVSKPAAENKGIVVESGMSVIDVLTKYPNATMAKIQKACEKSGLSIGPDMIIG